MFTGQTQLRAAVSRQVHVTVHPLLASKQSYAVFQDLLLRCARSLSPRHGRASVLDSRVPSWGEQNVKSVRKQQQPPQATFFLLYLHNTWKVIILSSVLYSNCIYESQLSRATPELCSITTTATITLLHITQSFTCTLQERWSGCISVSRKAW